MNLTNVERFIRRFPLLGDYYLRHYSQIRLNLINLNRIIPLLKFPRYVHLLVTYDCNFSCRQCQVNANRKRVNQLTLPEITRLIQDIKEAGVRHLIISGGEALTRADIFDILEVAENTGIPRITLATNGYLVGKYRKELASVRIDRVVISIDDVGEINDAIRGRNGAFQYALEALDIFRDIGVKSREVNTTVFPGAVSRMEKLAEYIGVSSATNWILGILIPIGRASLLENNTFEDSELMDLIELIKKLRTVMPVELNSHTGYMKNYFKDITSEPFFCRAGREVCAINPDGEVVPCNMTTDIKFSLGNIREKHFKEIWREGFREFRKSEYPQECKKCEFLAGCGGGCWGYRSINERYCYRDFCV
jgi:radical SAM protein with 4Fe4S-binding SPASM domain